MGHAASFGLGVAESNRLLGPYVSSPRDASPGIVAIIFDV